MTYIDAIKCILHRLEAARWWLVVLKVGYPIARAAIAAYRASQRPGKMLHRRKKGPKSPK